MVVIAVSQDFVPTLPFSIYSLNALGLHFTLSAF